MYEALSVVLHQAQLWRNRYDANRSVGLRRIEQNVEFRLRFIRQHHNVDHRFSLLVSFKQEGVTSLSKRLDILSRMAARVIHPTVIEVRSAITGYCAALHAATENRVLGRPEWPLTRKTLTVLYHWRVDGKTLDWQSVVKSAELRCASIKAVWQRLNSSTEGTPLEFNPNPVELPSPFAIDVPARLDPTDARAIVEDWGEAWATVVDEIDTFWPDEILAFANRAEGIDKHPGTDMV